MPELDETFVADTNKLLDRLTNRFQEVRNSLKDGKFDVDEFHQLRILSRNLTAYLTLQATTLGECRRDVPYAPLQPIIDADGNFKWCCTHSPTHCSS